MIVVKLPYFNLQNYLAAMKEFHGSVIANEEILLGPPFSSGKIRMCYADEDISVLRSDFLLENDMYSVQFNTAPPQQSLLHFYSFNKFEIVDGTILFQVDNKQKALQSGQNQIASYNTNRSKTLVAYPQHTNSSSIYVQVTDSWLEKNCEKLCLASNQLFSNPTSSLTFPVAPDSRFLVGHHVFFDYFDKADTLISPAEIHEVVCNYLNTSFLNAVITVTGYEETDVRLKINKMVVSMLGNLNKPLPSLDEVATMSGINPHTIRSYFRKAYGTSFHDYFAKRQMEWAKQYILLKSGTIKMLCHQIGYQNPSHFAKTFHKYIGILPSQISSKNKEE